MQPKFIHLRIHTEYSLSDGMTKIDSLMNLAARDHMPALGISDHHNLFAAIKFYKAALAKGIKPLIGADICIQRNEHSHFILTVFCQNTTGYQNLLEIISKSYLYRNSQEKIMISLEEFVKYSTGLILLSGANEGDVGQALLSGHSQQALQFAKFWQSHFYNRYYLEIKRTGHLHDEEHIQATLQLARATHLPVVATHLVCFETREDFEAHEARVCIYAGVTLADTRRLKLHTDQQYFRTQKEMAALFSDIPEALQNTVEISKRCTLDITLGKNFLPRCTVPDQFTTEKWLAYSAQVGLENHLKPLSLSQEKTKIYFDRLKKELDVITQMGFAAYFLIVADFTQWARENDVPVGPGRGSGPGSLVAWSLHITDLDPIAHELLFERFLNPERVSMPDFDIDFCIAGRDRVIDYVMQKHGKESVAQIITYGTMAARAVVRDVGRVLGLPYGFVDKLAKLIPFELGMTLDKALKQEIQLNARYSNEEDVRTLIDLAKRLEGITRNVGRHAGGVVIAPNRLTEFTPLYCEPNETDHPVTQFDKDDVEAVGLVKFDFLGLRTLTIIHGAIKNITQQNPSLKIDIRHIPMDDEKTFHLLKACQTTAVFQLESRGMKDLIKRLQPDCFEDIVALVALFRPGPLQSGMVDDFINRKHGRARVNYPHPKLEPILRSTYGVIVYQEQVMQIAQVLAGYSLGAADILRRAMGKKKPEEMAIQREIFCQGAIKRNVLAETATYIFDLMEKFAGYGFNKSHSASYALIAYQTAWLKTHFPASYMASVLSSDMDHTDKVVLFVNECITLGVNISPPNINEGEYYFKVIDEKNLAWGLGAIKGLGETAVATIISTREKNGVFKSIFDFCERVDGRKINKRALEILIRSGALDCLNAHRAMLMSNIDFVLHYATQTMQAKNVGQQNLFGSMTLPENLPLLKETPSWTETFRLKGEKETLGLYLSGHPIHPYLPELKNFTTHIVDLHPSSDKTIKFAGIVTQVRSIQTKRGDRMAVVSLEDHTGKIDAVCFADIFQTYRDLLVKDHLLIMIGEVNFDEFNSSNRFVTQEILSIEQARERFAKYLSIHLSEEKFPKLDILASILKQYQGGKCLIKIHYTQPQQARVALQLGENWRVKPHDILIEKLIEHLPNERIELIY